jgi:hypothetical protein
MPLSLISGTSTKVAQGSETTYAASGQYGPIAQHNTVITMRIDGRVVHFRTRTMPSISEGDVVAAAGKESGGTLYALALRNLTTGAIYCPATTLPMVGSIIVIVVGIPLIALLGLGLFFVGMGGWLLWRCLQIRKSCTMVMQAAAPAGA